MSFNIQRSILEGFGRCIFMNTSFAHALISISSCGPCGYSGTCATANGFEFWVSEWEDLFRDAIFLLLPAKMCITDLYFVTIALYWKIPSASNSTEKGAYSTFDILCACLSSLIPLQWYGWNLLVHLQIVDIPSLKSENEIEIGWLF